MLHDQYEGFDVSDLSILALTENWPEEWAAQITDLQVTQEDCFSTLAEGFLVGSDQDTKVMVKETMKSSAEARESVNNEIEFFKQLGGGDIASLFDSTTWWDDNTGMEVSLMLLEGGRGTLGQHIDEEAALPLGAVFQMMVEMLRGLEKLHKQGFIHRNLQPATIVMIGDCSSPAGCHSKISDLSSLWRLESPTETVREPIGIKGFTAPETYSEGAGFKSDVWSLGMVFYNMLFGGQPIGMCSFYLQSPAEFANLVNREFDIEYDPDFEMFKEYHPGIAAIIGNMLVPDPSKRWDVSRLLTEAETLAQRLNLEVPEQAPAVIPPAWPSKPF